ncbi:MAG: hypothetical protein E7673_07705, partial [Ruminococcaceae bacterium]|nr:hypothetical protein [Oscillospiraceae bacterium]
MKENLKRGCSDPAVIGELTDRATVNTKHFLMNNGTEKVVISSAPINYYNEKEQKWLEIDNSLHECEDGTLRANFGNYEIRILGEEEGEGVEITDGTRSVAWKYIGTEPPSDEKRMKLGKPREKKRSKRKAERCIDGGGLTKASRAVYEAAEGGVDIEYSIHNNKLKENIIIKERADSYCYFFDFSVKGLSMRLSADGKYVDFFKENSEAPEFRMPCPYMTDAEDKKSYDVYYDIEKADGDGYILSVNASADWINKEDTVFPVTVDPTLQSGIQTYTPPITLTPLISTYTSSAGEVLVESPDSDGREISYYNETNCLMQVKLSDPCFSGNESILRKTIKAYLIIPLSCCEYYSEYEEPVLTIRETGEVFYPKYLIDHGENLKIDITNALTKPLTYTLEVNYGTLLTLSYSTDPYIELQYAYNESDNLATESFDLDEHISTTIDFARSEQEFTFSDISDPHVGVVISHNFKAGSDLKRGKGFRLNIDETLTKTEYNYCYTDSAGNGHIFDEVFYTVNDSEEKEVVIKNTVTADTDGRLWYLGKEVFRELVSKDGYKATAQLEGVKNCELIETRSDEAKQLEEQKEAYETALEDFIIINKESGEENKSYTSIEAYIKAKDENNILLTKSEALDYRSTILDIESTSADINTLSNPNNDSTDTDNSEDIELAINILNKKNTLLSAKKDLLIEKGENYNTLYNKYKKENANLTAKLAELKLHIPTSYLISDSQIKGYNANGNLCVIQDRHGNYILFERAKTSAGTYDVVAISDNNDARMTFEYYNNGMLKSITNSLGETVSYDYISGGYLKNINFHNGDYIYLAYIQNVERISKIIKRLKGGSIATEIIQSHINNDIISSIEKNTYIKKAEHGHISNEKTTVSNIDIAYTENRATVTETDKPTRIYVYTDESNLKEYYETVKNKVTRAECYYKNNYSDKIITEFAKKSSLNKTPYESFTFEADGYEIITLNSFKDVESKTASEDKDGTNKTVTTYTYNSDRKPVRTETVITKNGTNIGTVIEEYRYN